MAPKHTSPSPEATNNPYPEFKQPSQLSAETSPDLEAAIERSRSQISHLEHQTGIDRKYGEGTWRPAQSVVDILQNHLDANTTLFEKSRLELVGIDEYNPSSSTQATILEQLAIINSSEELPDQLAAYNKLIDHLSLSPRELQQRRDSQMHLEALRQDLSEVTYQLPTVKLKLRNGQQTKFVDYHQVHQEPAEWQAVGYLAADRGSGFDHTLLSMIGASTKKDDATKRGGLGEGLKMSVAQLNRVGAEVRLVSQNPDESWWLQPQDDGDLVVLTGKKVDRQPAPDQQSLPTGSRTLVDLSNANLSEEEWQHIRQVIDPRQGQQGLAKYILEFHPHITPDQIETNTRLDSEIMTPGRVYVKGLLIEEGRPDLLWSYNLSQKWAISGRDRKTVHRQHLSKAIKEHLERLDQPQAIEQLVSIIKSSSQQPPNQLEFKNLPTGEAFSPEQKQLWQQAFRDVLQIVPGKVILAPNNLPLEKQRLLEDRGYTLIAIDPGLSNIPILLKSLFDQPTHAEHALEAAATPAQQETFDDPALESVLRHTTEQFKGLELKYQLKNPTIDNIRFVRLSPEKEDQAFMEDYPFKLDPIQKTVAIDGSYNFASPYARDVEAIVLSAHIQSQREAFTDELQDTLEDWVARELFMGHPELQRINNLYAISARETETMPRTRYAERHKYQDATFQKLSQTVSLLKSPSLNSITRDHLQQNLTETSQLIDKHHLRLVFEDYIEANLPTPPFLLEGRLASVDRELNIIDLDQLDPEDAPVLVQPPQSITQTTEINLRLYDYCIPLPEPIGQITTYTLTSHGHSVTVSLTRTSQGYHFLPTSNQHHEPRIDDDPELLQIPISGKSLYASIQNNLLIIDGDVEHVDVAYAQSLAEQLPERNHGQPYIPANTTLDYGEKVWSDPRRILLDAIQNHLDANQGDLPKIEFEVANHQGHIQHLPASQLVNLSKDWIVIGISIEDQGDGYTTPYLTQLGSSSKDVHQVGKFGEGLKMLAASATRQGIHLELNSRDWTALATSHIQSAINHETNQTEDFQMLGYQMQWHQQPRQGSKTTFSLFGPNQHKLGSEQLEMLQQLGQPNQHKSEQLQTWQQWLSILDPRQSPSQATPGLERYILPEEGQRAGTSQVSILLDRPGQIFEKNLLVPDGQASLPDGTPLLLGYNLLESAINTRERNAVDPNAFKRIVTQYLTQTTDIEVMTHILTHAKHNPQTNYLEYELLQKIRTFREPMESNQRLWRIAYHQVFGEDAVLSIRNRGSIYEKIESQLKVHLERANTITLPSSLTKFLDNFVYDSFNFNHDIGGQHITLTDSEKQILHNYIQQVNQIIAGHFMDMLRDPDKREYLARPWQQTNKQLQAEDSGSQSSQHDLPTIDQEAAIHQLQQRIDQLLNMSENDIAVGSKFNSNGGLYTGIVNDAAQIQVNQNCFLDPSRLLKTYIHESMHHLSGQTDYKLNFLRYFAALALQAREAGTVQYNSAATAERLLIYARRFIDHA